MKFLTLAITAIILLTSSFAIAEQTKLAVDKEMISPEKCSPSKSRLFDNRYASKRKKIVLKSDFKTLFNKEGPVFEAVEELAEEEISDDEYKEKLYEAGKYGVIYYPDAVDEISSFIPVMFVLRGKTRLYYCTVPPLRVVFLLQPSSEKKIAKLNSKGRDNWKDIGITQEQHLKIIENMQKKNIVDQEQKIQFYYDKFIAIMKDRPISLKGFSQDKGNIFKGNGDDIKLVTHCGQSYWDEISGPTYNDQEIRVLREFYTYQILNTFETTVLKTSLVELSYIESVSLKPNLYDGKTYVLGFFREPKSKLAARCGLKLKKDDSQTAENTKQSSSLRSKLQAELISRFVANLDFKVASKNVIHMFDEFNNKYYAPYDFDLTGIITDNYRDPGTIAERSKEFDEWLRSFDGNLMMKALVTKLLEKMDQIEIVINQAELEIAKIDQESEKRFSSWLKHYSKTLLEYKARN